LCCTFLPLVTRTGKAKHQREVVGRELETPQPRPFVRQSHTDRKTQAHTIPTSTSYKVLEDIRSKTHNGVRNGPDAVHISGRDV